ncbi:MAG TPA: transposase [Candidatus Dormibacteraeota bacterium]|nr:transposase [Candidatus Dormibacteraeota bacterium]
MRRLLPIPGMGFITAVTIMAEVWDLQRFQSPRHLCSWAGLTPKEHSSAGHTRRGHISKQGSRWGRWVLVEAAPHAFQNVHLRQWYLPIADRRGDKIARVAVARRLLTLAYYALRDPQGCRSVPRRPWSGALASCHGRTLTAADRD